VHAPSPASGIDADFLTANSETYEWLVEKPKSMKLQMGTKEAVLHRLQNVATFAMQFHPGRFADGMLENPVLELGADLEKPVSVAGDFQLPVVRERGRRRVLHVTLSLALGGHSPLLYQWVRNDKSSCHSVVLLNQQSEVPDVWQEALKHEGGSLIVLPPARSLLEKAWWLRELARRTADLVVLHVICPDVVPVVAFATDSCPPVVIVDHADHMFWLGGTIADMLVNLRSLGAHHTAARRFLRRNAILPIPLVDSAGETSRHAARQALGIGADQIVLLSVGRDIKYRPCGSYDFVATANKILDSHTKAHLYVVGASAQGMAPYLRCRPHERLHFVGRVDNPTLYRMAADVYLESFPYGSQTALLEAALRGLPVVPAYSPLAPMLVANDDALRDLLTNPGDEHEYVERACQFIGKPGHRIELGQVLRQRLLVDHVGEGWLDRLAAMYREADGLAHRPQAIPNSQCQTTHADIGLSLWQAMACCPATSVRGNPSDKAATVLHYRAFVAKAAGNYAHARRYAWRAIGHAPFRQQHWRLLLIAMLGRVAGPLRSAFR